jgi:RNA polymerase sigma-70 factor (ECF subfamily)
MSEEEIIEGCKQGNRQAQQRLYNLYKSKLYAVCVRYAANKMEAEDVLQEGFLKIFNNIHKYQFTGAFGAWVKTVMVNTAIEQYRRNKRSIIDVTDEMPVGAAFDDNIIERMEGRKVLELIQNMPEGYRQVFNLYAVEGYKHHEIGTMLGISEGTSKSQYARGRKFLQDLMSKYYQTESSHVRTGF